MINLIPPTAQKQVTREYWVRVVSVWLFLVGTAFLIVALLNAPVYVLVQSQLDTFLQEFNLASNQSETFKNSEASIGQVNTIAQLLTKKENVAPFSTIIAELENQAKAEGGILITNLSLSRKDDTLAPVAISGVASSRLSLSTFREALEKNERFESATLPLSSFAKDKDIPFSITLTPSKVVKP
jgi:hypothetical protein